ncbi:MAG: hydroxyisourate hydrolase [Solibacillus sp.]
MPSLSTHILDLYSGKPAANVQIDVRYKAADADWVLLQTITTNNDGRTDLPALAEEAWQSGSYELLFYIGDYFATKGIALPEPAFLSDVPVRFTMHAEGGHYHVPLLVSPWGYQIYRGS